jgi:four helix bundle protein
MNLKITRFEDLECWQEAKLLTRSVYAYAKRANFSKDLRLSGQITGAAISVMNNICEGFDSKSNREFIRFLTYSRRSCSEVQNCLYADDFQNTYDHCAKVRKIIDGLIRYLNRPRANRLTGHGPTGQPT